MLLFQSSISHIVSARPLGSIHFKVTNYKHTKDFACCKSKAIEETTHQAVVGDIMYIFICLISGYTETASSSGSLVLYRSWVGPIFKSMGSRRKEIIMVVLLAQLARYRNLLARYRNFSCCYLD